MVHIGGIVLIHFFFMVQVQVVYSNSSHHHWHREINILTKRTNCNRINVVQKLAYKALSFFASRELFRQEIRSIVACIHIRGSPFIACNAFSHEVISDALVFLLQRWIRDGRVCQYWLVITWNVDGSIAWNTHHTKLVSQASQIFTALFHGNKLRTKTAGFHARLLTGHPMR